MKTSPSITTLDPAQAVRRVPRPSLLQKAVLKGFEAIEAGHLDMLRAQGVKIARSYAAVDRVGGVEGHDKESVYATPNTGVMHHARQNDGINLDDSWVIAGDVESLISGWRAGCHTAGVGLPRLI